MRNQKTMKTLWKKVTSSSSPYNRFDDEEDKLKENEQDRKCAQEKEKCEIKKANCDDATASKKKRKGWKRLRHAALATCRYIGIGVSHISPISMYPPGDYNMDPYGWCTSVNSVNGKTQPPHWTTGIILNGW